MAKTCTIYFTVVGYKKSYDDKYYCYCDGDGGGGGSDDDDDYD